MQINLEQLRNLDGETKERYLEMLREVPEPNWQESLAKLLVILKQLRDNFAEHDDNVVIRVSAVATIIHKIMVDPEVAGDAYRFLEHNKRAIDIIALEQIMALDADQDQDDGRSSASSGK